MRSRHVHYDLHNGYIDHWLAAGPQAIPLQPGAFSAGDLIGAARLFYMPEWGISATPVERGPLTKGLFTIGDYTGSWEYTCCREDHALDHSGVYPAWHYLRSWAYVQLMSETDQQVTLVVSTHGPADVWLNRALLGRSEQFSGQSPVQVSYHAALKAGENPLMVRFETVGVRACPHAISVRILAPAADAASPAPGVHVRFPTLIPSLSRRNDFEKVAETVYLTRDAYAGDTPIQACWPAENPRNSLADVLLQHPSGRTYGQAEVNGEPGDKLFLGTAFNGPPGPRQALIMPRAWEFYNKDIRIVRKLPCWSLGPRTYSHGTYGEPAARRQEALIDAAQLESSIFSEIAKMALGAWQEVSQAALLAGIGEVDQRRDGSSLVLLGLVGVTYRFADAPDFPAALRDALKACLLGYRYWQDEPGDLDGLDFSAPDDWILFHTCELLAGQRYPAEIFIASGKPGSWHAERGERLALEWLEEHSAWGFADWGSPASLEQALAALTHLGDLAEAKPVWELAVVVMDKLLAELAIHSYHGVYGAPHRRGDPLAVKSGLLSPTAGISRLLWGSGIFNQHTAGVVSLACDEQYELPLLLPQIAADQPEECWGREQQALPGDPAGPVNRVMYKTPDYLLSSAQDYAPGSRGDQEQLWQAVLGPETLVFSNHPGCASENEARRPNFWLGNASLPRIAQWKDTLIAIYHLPADDPLGFTHAYFPALSFDEYLLRSGWAFARQGSGYLALTNSLAIDLIRQGPYAYRELRAAGLEQVWLCQLGRAALDGDFAAFQEKVLASQPDFDGLNVHHLSMRGTTLNFGWEGPLLVDGSPQPLAGFKHIENLYAEAELPCQQMLIHSGEDGLRLDFQIGPTRSDVS